MNIKKHLILFFVYTLIISPLCHPQRVEALESPQEIIFNRIANDLQQGHFKKEPRCESGLFLYTNTYSFEFPKSARSDWRNMVERASQKAKLWHTSGYCCRQSSIQDFSVEETSSSVSLHFTCFLYSENLDREVKEAQGVTEKVQALAKTAKKKTSSKREQFKFFHDAMKKSTTYRFDSGKREQGIQGFQSRRPVFWRGWELLRLLPDYSSLHLSHWRPCRVRGRDYKRRQTRLEPRTPWQGCILFRSQC